MLGKYQTFLINNNINWAKNFMKTVCFLKTGFGAVLLPSAWSFLHCFLGQGRAIRGSLVDGWLVVMGVGLFVQHACDITAIHLQSPVYSI